MALTHEEIFERVREAFREELGEEAVAELTEDMGLEEDLGVDSLDAVALVMQIEDVFGIKISDEDAKALKTVGQVVDYVSGHQPQTA